jgi:hypothetical protein
MHQRVLIYKHMHMCAVMIPPLLLIQLETA